MQPQWPHDMTPLVTFLAGSISASATVGPSPDASPKLPNNKQSRKGLFGES